MKTARKITLTKEERTMLSVWLRLRTPTRLALRANIILLAADGGTNREIAGRLQASPKTVSLWRRRFLAGRLAGIEKEAPRSKLKINETMSQLILHKTMKERPPNAIRWTTRSLAKELGVSPSMVQRVWKANGLNSRHTTPSA
jgi:transposase